MKFITARFEEDEFAAIEKAAAQKQLAKDEWVRQVVLHELESIYRNEKEAEYFRRRFRPDPKPSSTKKKRR